MYSLGYAAGSRLLCLQHEQAHHDAGRWQMYHNCGTCTDRGIACKVAEKLMTAEWGNGRTYACWYSQTLAAHYWVWDYLPVVSTLRAGCNSFRLAVGGFNTLD
jgi:hypothetical protein